MSELARKRWQLLGEVSAHQSYCGYLYEK